jgi:predicted RNase H-like nuclease (RuvC/YqgF family)
MTRKLHPILLPEEQIDRLTKRNRELERGNRSLWKENEKLREKIKKLTRRENELSGVNI